MEQIPQLLAALAFFGAIVVCPLVYLFLKHQRAMADLIHRNPAMETLQRLENVERELRELRASQNAQIIRDDEKQELGRHTT